MKQGKNIVELAQELQARAENKHDLVADTREVKLHQPAYQGVPGDTIELPVQLSVGGDRFDVTKHTHRQIGDRLGIPAKYYDRMLTEAPALLAANANHWFENNPERRLVRTLNGTARAFLSDRYHRIDNEDVAEAVLPALLESDSIEVVSADVTDSKLYIKALFPKVRNEVVVGDEVQAGIVISNSEIGLGSLSIQPLVYRLVCLNGMIVNDSALRRYHVGKRIDGIDGTAVEALLRDETKAADDHALMMKVQDIVRGAANQKTFDAMVARMREAAQGERIEKPAPAVEVLGKSLGLNETEKGKVLENLIRGGDYSRWGALNAVTAVANNHDDYDRATDLEAAGGKVLELSPNDWHQVALAA